MPLNCQHPVIGLNQDGKMILCCGDCDKPEDLCNCDRYDMNKQFKCQFNRFVTDQRSDPFTAFSGTWDRWVDAMAGYRWWSDSSLDDSRLSNGDLDITYWNRDTTGPDNNLGKDWWPPVNMRSLTVETPMRPIISPSTGRQWYQGFYDYSIEQPPINVRFLGGYAGIQSRCEKPNQFEDATCLVNYCNHKYGQIYPPEPTTYFGEELYTAHKKNYKTEYYDGMADSVPSTPLIGIGKMFGRVTEAANTNWSSPSQSDTNDPNSPVCKINSSADDRLCPDGPYAKLNIDWGGDNWDFGAKAPIAYGKSISTVSASGRWILGGTLYGGYNGSVSSWGQDNGPRTMDTNNPGFNDGTDIPLHVKVELNIRKRNVNGVVGWTITMSQKIINKYLDYAGEFPPVGLNNKIRPCAYSSVGGVLSGDINYCYGDPPRIDNYYDDTVFVGARPQDLTLTGPIYRIATKEYGTWNNGLDFNCASQVVDTGKKFTVTVSFVNTPDIVV